MDTKHIDKDKFYKVLIALLLFLSIASIDSCVRNKAELKDANQNLIALNDSVRYVKNKNGALEAQKALLIADNKDLKKLNSDLQDELKSERGKVIYIDKIQTKIVHDTTYIHTELVDNKFAFAYDTTYSKGNSRTLAIEGEVNGNDVDCKIVKDEFSVAIVTGIKKENGVAQIFVRSDYPGFNVSSIDGAILSQDDPIFAQDAKKKHFIIGPQVGIGVSAGLKLTPYIGAGLTYKIIAF